jgi:polyhydroxyalkanoate synthase
MKYWIAEQLPEDTDEWISLAEEVSGSWRIHWIDWLKQRSGPLLDAKQELGSAEHPALDVAPGRYVLER